jgi:ubiquinol-cytochrome c reductase cytochrome b subunit
MSGPSDGRRPAPQGPDGSPAPGTAAEDAVPGAEEEMVAPEIEGTPTWRYLKERFGFGRFVLEAMNAPHPRFMNPLDFLGDILIFLFINQVVTGLLLMTHYQASAATTPAAAYLSTLAISRNHFESFVRDLHFWGANAMVVAIALHVARVFYVGAYKPPREYQWLSGLVLLACTVGLALSGYLLPWDQQAYWATEVATAMVKYIPVIGHDLLYFIRGCRYTCASTLTLFYAIHTVLLPLILFATIGVHVLLVIVHGQVDVEARLPKGYRERHRLGATADFPKGYVPFWPNTVAVMMLYMLGAGVVVAIIAAFVPAPLHPAANYVNVPPAVPQQYRPVPVWYFLNFYQYLKLFHGYLEDELAILATPLIIVAAMILLPFLDRNPSHRPKDRPYVLTVGALFSAAVLWFTYSGWKSEQPPPVLTKAIANPSYSRDLLPIFNTECTPCHTNAPFLGNFQVNTYQGIMKGGVLGPALIPGDPAKSTIILLLEGKDPQVPGLQMPLGRTPLSKAQIQTIANWIREGAKDN